MRYAADRPLRLSATLTAYPARGRQRTWHRRLAVTRDGWAVARIDLGAEEDGGPSARERLQLTLTLAHDAVSPEDGALTLERVAFVRRVIAVTFDPLAAEPIRERGTAGWGYTLTVRNEDLAPHLARVWLDTAALTAFDPSWAQLDLTLGARETRRVPLTLTMPEAEWRRRVPIFAEPAQVFVQPLDVAAPAITPLCDDRPRLLWAVIPPQSAGLHPTLPEGPHPPNPLLPEEKGEQHTIAPLLGERGWGEGKSEGWGEGSLRARAEEALAAPWGEHADMVARADLLAAAYHADGDPRFAAAARDLLLARSAPPQTPGLLGQLAESYAKIRYSPAMGEEDRRAIERDLLVPGIRNMHALSGTRADAQVACARVAFALDAYWPLLGEALYGPRGYFAVLERDYTEDGSPRERGAAREATFGALMTLATLLHRHGVNVMTPRVKRVFDALVRDTPDGVVEGAEAFALAFAAFGDPRYIPTLKAAGQWPPPGISRSRARALVKQSLTETRSALLPEAGVLWLREDSPRGFRAASLHLTARQRGASDQLHLSLFDPHPLSGASLLPDAIARNAMVVDQRNPLPAPARVAVFLDRVTRPAALLTEEEDAPLYPGARVARAVALLDGLFFIGELYHAPDGPHCFDWPFHTPWPSSDREGVGALELSLEMTALDGLLGLHDGYPRLVARDAAVTGRAFTARVPGERQALHLAFAPMEDAQVIRARAPRETGPASLLLVRQDRRRVARLGVALDVTAPDAPSRVTQVMNVPVAVGRRPTPPHLAAAWVVRTRAAAYLVLINRTAAAVTAANLTTADMLVVERL